jgi:hypothetical protein
MKTGLLPTLGLIYLAIIMFLDHQKIQHLEHRVSALETQYGVVINGMDYQIFKCFPPIQP